MDFVEVHRFLFVLLVDRCICTFFFRFVDIPCGIFIETDIEFESGIVGVEWLWTDGALIKLITSVVIGIGKVSPDRVGFDTLPRASVEGHEVISRLILAVVIHSTSMVDNEIGADVAGVERLCQRAAAYDSIEVILHHG